MSIQNGGSQKDTKASHNIENNKNEVKDDSKVDNNTKLPPEMQHAIKIVDTIVKENLKPYAKILEQHAAKMEAIDNVLTELDPLIQEFKNYKQQSGNSQPANGNVTQQSNGQPDMGGIQVIGDILKSLGIGGNSNSGDQTLMKFFMELGMRKFESDSKLSDAITSAIINNGITIPTGKDMSKRPKLPDIGEMQ